MSHSALIVLHPRIFMKVQQMLTERWKKNSRSF